MTAGTKTSLRIAIATPSSADLRHDQLPLITRLIESGHAVLCLSPIVHEADALALTHRGADVETIDLATERYTLMRERQVTKRIARTLSTWEADIVVASGLGVMSAVTGAAQKAKIAKIIAVMDLPISEPELTVATELEGETDGEAAEAPQRETDGRLMRAFDAASDILCFNYDDAAQLALSGLLPEGVIPSVLPGLGVDLEAFDVAELPETRNGLTFLMLADMAASRGVLDFCRAAEIVKKRAPHAEFLLAGPASRTHDGLSLADISQYREVVNYLGDGSNSAEVISQCHVFVYPSHGEPHPAHLLEAIAMGRPVIAGDAPGCREAVDERVNGCLADPGDPESLADAMESYLKRPDLIPSMARASRQKAERRYDRRLVMAALFDLMGLERAAG